MDIQNKTILIIGGWGLVGRTLTRKLLIEKPKRIIVTSLKKEEALEEVELLRKENPKLPKDFFIPWWGNILIRDQYKNEDRLDILNNPKKRKILMHDTLDELDPKILKGAALYKLINKYKPDVVVDCINTATGIAYQDIYSLYRKIKHNLNNNPTLEGVIEDLEKVLCSMYVPQLIRHIQILYNAMHDAKTNLYFKVGTSGTGGMGLNIPYTHSEEKPSRVLLSKSAVAGAHTMLLFLMGRTPDSAITKEIKPAAAIAWKKIEFGTVKRKGKPIKLFNVGVDEAIELKDKFYFKSKNKFQETKDVLKSVYIDTGENGIFSKGEFEAISAQKQMEFVTPEEISDNIIYEIKGGNTGRDIINSLDVASLQPSYRAGYMQHFAVEKLAELEEKNEVYSVAFEMLGPPKLSKLLFEIHLLKLIVGDMFGILAETPKKLSQKCFEYLNENPKFRNEMVSIGLPVLLPDGKSLLRGPDVKIPVQRGDDFLPVTKKNIELWAEDGWVDLREKNMKIWQKRIQSIMKDAESIGEFDTSSAHVRTRQYWHDFKTINIGRVVSWLFIHEEKGRRMKA
ncbi:MAG: short-chain dehydrogenase [Chlorobiaceae bacterium]|nr:short-chain dehydrogenase [Chlorobiaceae bacterium]MBA4309302.1 short-chain dehydrogenase [Chlorobiaceae bacterium]